jgi:folate-binding protein YgfZ
MVSNEVKNLGVGQGNYAFVLDPHGHILADARVLRIGAETFWLDCEPQGLQVVSQALRSHIIADKVKVEEQTSELACLALEGPCAREVLREAIGFDPPHMRLLEHLEVPGLELRLAWVALSGEQGFWIWAAPEKLATVWDGCLKTGEWLGVQPVGHEAVEICRIEAGIPRYGVDMDEKTLPQETNQMQALSFTKGCYVGQEVIERIRSRGQVNRKLAGLLFDGPCHVAGGADIVLNGQSIGEITSAAYSYGLRRTIALGMIRQEHAEAGTAVQVGDFAAEVGSLPFLFPTSRS